METPIFPYTASQDLLLDTKLPSQSRETHVNCDPILCSSMLVFGSHFNPESTCEAKFEVLRTHSDVF